MANWAEVLFCVVGGRVFVEFNFEIRKSPKDQQSPTAPNRERKDCSLQTQTGHHKGGKEVNLFMSDIEKGDQVSRRSSAPVSGSLRDFLTTVGVVHQHSTSSVSLTDKTSHQRRDMGPMGTSSMPSVFNSSLDLTPERLAYVFAQFDTDDDGRIDYESLKQGLDYAGQRFKEGDNSFQKLVDHLDMDKSGDISFQEFCEGLRLLMLRDLFQRSPDHGEISVFDYDPIRMEQWMVRSKNNSLSDGGKINRMDDQIFFFDSRPTWVTTRWVHVTGKDKEASASTLQKLAVLYALHPLALEDALSPESHRPKAELYSSHYFIMCPYFEIEWESVDESLRKKKSWLGAACRWPIHCLRRLQTKTENEDATTATRRLSKIHTRMASLFVATEESTMVTYLQGEHNLWPRVQQELELSYSKLRQYDQEYLTYALLDEAVDAIGPLVGHISQAVENERDYLESTGFESLQRIHHLQNQIQKVGQKLKPFMRLLTHVIEDDAISPGATIYLLDVLDNLEGYDEEVRQLLNTCVAVDAEAEKFQSRQMDRTLYTLTVISAVFLPAQFLTGVWGMNFQDMPELSQPWGYELFWVIAVSLMLTMIVALNCGRIR